MNADLPQWSADEVGRSPLTMLIISDSDIVQPEHAVEMFRLLGGGVIGDLVGLPARGGRAPPAPPRHPGAADRLAVLDGRRFPTPGRLNQVG